MFLEEDHIFTNEEALEKAIAMSCAQPLNFVGGFAAGKYIDEEMVDAEHDWKFIEKKYQDFNNETSSHLYIFYISVLESLECWKKAYYLARFLKCGMDNQPH